MADITATKQAHPEHGEHVDAVESWEMKAVHEKELRDAEALHALAPDIPLREVMEAHLEEDQKRVKKIIRKVDFRQIPILALVYIWAYIDRTNLGNVSL